jgi:hypothetical protein
MRDHTESRAVCKGIGATLGDHRLIVWQSWAIPLSPAAFPFPSGFGFVPVMRHARQITLVLQDRDTEKPAELDIATVQELLAQEPVISHTETAGRMVIYSLDRRAESSRDVLFRSIANDHGKKK